MQSVEPSVKGYSMMEGNTALDRERQVIGSNGTVCLLMKWMFVSRECSQLSWHVMVEFLLGDACEVLS